LIKGISAVQFAKTFTSNYDKE